MEWLMFVEMRQPLSSTEYEDVGDRNEQYVDDLLGADNDVRFLSPRNVPTCDRNVSLLEIDEV